MGEIAKYTSAKTKIFANMKNPLDILDTDCRNAINHISTIHPSVMPVAKKLCSLVSPFVPCIDDEQMLVQKILRQAANDFEDGLTMNDMRLAYFNFFNTIKSSLPQLLNYTIEVKNGHRLNVNIDIMSESVQDALFKKPYAVRIFYDPITAGITNHELSLILLPRVFNRAQMINIGIPSCGFNYVDDLKNRRHSIADGAEE